MELQTVEYIKLDVMVPLTEKSRNNFGGRSILQLGSRLCCFMQKIWQEESSQESGHKFAPDNGGRSDTVFKRLTITLYEFLARRCLSSSVFVSVREKTEQQHSSRAGPRARFVLNAGNIVGIRAGGLR